jgi:hypothetical protein
MMSQSTTYWYHDDAKSIVRAKMTARTLTFPDSKSFIEAVGEIFTLRFLPKKTQSGFYPLAVEHKEDDKVTSYTRDIVFPIKYHTLSLAEPNPAYPNEKPYCTLVPIAYDPAAVDYDFLISHQKDEEGYLLDLYNEGLLPRMRDLVRLNEDPTKEGICGQPLHSIADLKIKLPVNMKNFNFNDLQTKVKPDQAYLALRILGGWRMEVQPAIDTLPADQLWSCRVGVTFGLYPWTVPNLKVYAAPRPSSLSSQRKRKAEDVPATPVVLESESVSA